MISVHSSDSVPLKEKTSSGAYIAVTVGGDPVDVGPEEAQEDNNCEPTDKQVQ